MKLAYLDTELGADLDGAVAVVDCKIMLPYCRCHHGVTTQRHLLPILSLLSPSLLNLDEVVL